MTEYTSIEGASTSPPPSLHHAPTPKQRKKSEGIGNIISTVGVLLLAPVIALFLTAFVFQSYQVDGPSMQTTLQDKDRLIVWKVPKTWARLTGGVYIPNRGDVVIFTENALANYGQDPTKQLIKRVIALPGERVVIKDGVVTVYNKEQPQGFIPDQTLPYGDVITDSPGDTDVVVPNEKIFVLGDNRTNSLDSSEFGPIDTHAIVGKLVLRIMPIGDMKAF
jgi:signal peptidase I